MGAWPSSVPSGCLVPPFSSLQQEPGLKQGKGQVLQSAMSREAGCVTVYSECNLEGSNYYPSYPGSKCSLPRRVRTAHPRWGQEVRGRPGVSLHSSAGHYAPWLAEVGSGGLGRWWAPSVCILCQGVGVPSHRESLPFLQGTLSTKEHILVFGRPRLRVFRTKSAPLLLFLLSWQRHCCSF